MKLVHRLPLAFGIVLSIASAAGLFGVVQMNDAANAYERAASSGRAPARNP
jgi:hypothetical protein